MGICLSLCGRTGKYKPRKMEEEDRARNREIQHNVYRKANDAQTDSKTVAQSMPFTVRVYGDDSEEMPKHYQITSEEFKDFIQDLISFEGMDSPNEYQEMKLTGEQKEAIKVYFSRLTRNELSFCYQYFPPFLPPGPDGISANHLELYLEKGDLDVIYAAIEYLRQRQFHKLIRALDRLNNYFSLGIDEKAAKAIALEIFLKWEKPYQRFTSVNNSRVERAAVCFYFIRDVVPNLRFTQPQGCIIPWILFQVLHPIEENSGFLRVDGENLVESTSDRERGSFPPAVDLVEEYRKSTLIKMEDELNSFVKTDCRRATSIECNLIRDVYDCSEVDKSTMAKSIPLEYADDIWICYYTVYKHFTGDALSAALNSKAPIGSLKEYVLLQENTDTIVKCHQLAEQHDGVPEKEGEIMRRVNGNLAGKPNKEGEIVRVNFAETQNEEGDIMRHVDNHHRAPDEEGKIAPLVEFSERPNEEGEITCNVDKNQTRAPDEDGEIMRHADENLPGEPNEGVIMHFNESMIGDANDDQDMTDRELGVPRREEFFEIKERAEKQKRWKRRFDSTKGTESEHEETKS